MILLDPNVLVYALNEDAPQHEASRALVERALAGRVPAALVPQVLVEAFAILTDPRRIERPLGPSEAWAALTPARLALPVLPLDGRALEEVADLLVERPTAGQGVFDVLLVAQMRAHGLAAVCTYNVQDFEGFAELLVEPPERVLARRWAGRGLRARGPGRPAPPRRA